MRSWIVIAAFSLGFLASPPAGATGRGRADAAAGGARRTTTPAAENAAVAAVRAYADSLAGVGDFSGALLLSRDGEPLLRRAYGMADREAKRPNRPDTKFNLGSINKLFTKIAVLQLAERGKLGLDDPIGRHLPDYPGEKGSRITVRMLLDHRGGTGDIFREGYRDARAGLRTIGDYYRFVRDQPLEFEPGTRRAYSNAGYVILGAILERVSGRDYYDYVRDHVYRPSAMMGTDAYALSDATPNRAVGYTQQTLEEDGDEDPPFRPNADFLPARGSSAGGGYSTVDDLASFVSALRAGRLLGPEGTSEVMGPEGGLGVAGGAPGVNAVLEVMGPYTLAVMANQDPPAAERVARYARARLAAVAGIAIEDGEEAGSPVIVRRGAGPGRDDPLSKPKRSFVPPQGIDVPMLLAAHLPAVDVMVNGRGPFRFAIDTGGAGALRVNAAFAERMGLKAVGEVWAGDPSGKNREKRDVVAVDSLQLGDATFVRMDASTRSDEHAARLPGVDGILGFGLFSGYTVTFDYPAGRLRLDSKDLPPPNGVDILAYDDGDGVPSVTIRVDSLEMVAHVDAGSMGGFVLPERIMRRLPLSAEPAVVGRARTIGNTFEIKAAPLRGTLRIGGVEFVDPQLEFQPIMPDANVGSRVLKDFRVSFDTRNKRIRLTRAS